MLTIKNIDKIVGKRIVNEWYIKSMRGMIRYFNDKLMYKECYKIIIYNKISNSEGVIYLDREYLNKEIKRYYELYCDRGGNRHTELLSKGTINDIKELIERIKQVADIN